MDWISTKLESKLPDFQEPVLIYVGGEHLVSHREQRGPYWVWRKEGPSSIGPESVRYWRELPPPPFDA